MSTSEADTVFAGTGSAPGPESQLRLLVEYAPVALAMFDRQMCYLAASSRWLADYGLEGRPVLGRSHYDLFPELPARWRQVHQRALQGSIERAEEDPFVRSDGRTQWIRWEVRPWRQAGEIGGIVIFAEEITARKEAELERDRLHFEIAQRSEQLRHLAFDLEAAEERERRQVARDLHDDLAQTLSAAQIRLAGLCGHRNQEVRRAAQEVASLLGDADRSTRSLAARLAPAVLDRLGLVPALRSLADEVESAFGLAVSVQDDGVRRPISQEGRSIVYRAVRELLINAARHSKAGSATVSIRGTDDELIVVVSDQGAGFATPVGASVRGGSGLSMIRERLSLIGGSLDLESNPGSGTVAVLTVSLAAGSSGTAGLALSAPPPEDELFRSVSRKAEIFEGIFEATLDAILVVDHRGRIRRVNTPGARMFGYEVAELLGTGVEVLVPERVAQHHARLRADYHGPPRRMGAGTELLARRKDGAEFPVDILLNPIGAGDDAPTLAVVRDITEQKRGQQKLAEQHELLRVTLDSIGDAVITADPAGRIQWLNPVASRLTGWLLSEACGQPIDQVFHIVHEETRHPALSPFMRALAEKRIVALPENTVLIARDGAEHGIEDSAAPIRDSQGNVLGIVLVFHDVTEQRSLAREVSHRATHDALTGLVNRSEFEMRLRRVFASPPEDGQAHALMYIDLDQFKLVNDACGHAAGDRLLREVAALFQGVIRTRDTLARLGGDEFGVLLEHCSVKQARRVAEELCDRMEHFRFIHDDRRFRVGASIGIVPLDGRWASEPEVMQAADAACYAAKEAGRNRVHEWFDADVTLKQRHGDMQWVTRLEHALDERRFRLYAQRIEPCVAATGGIHLEVLLRLVDLDGTVIAPGVFLPAAERFNLVSRIDRWVVREVVDWMTSHDLEAIETVAVNLSGQSIGDKSFHRFVSDLISQAALQPARLCFEITETAAITHMGEAKAFISAMRGLGVRIALDDFGAGASSFGYLKSLPVDFLKIDGQFIADILHDQLDRTAVSCFRDIAKVCGVQTIAECVESEEILAELCRIGIDYAQGYLIHKPEPLEELASSTHTLRN